MNGHIVFFDSAYLGFASVGVKMGGFDKDTYALRTLAKDYNKILVAQSYSKNLGLYGERIGCLSLVTESEEEKEVM